MLRLLVLALSTVCVALALGTPVSGSPLVNTTTIVVDEAFGGIGLNCATGNLAESDGVFSGVIHTLVRADGSVLVSAHTRGTDALDDLPTDGIVDATTTFVFNSNDIVFATGSEVHHFTGSGTITVTTTGVERRFQVVVQVVLGRDGLPKLDVLRFRC